MLEIIVKSVIFLVLLALGGYFFVCFRKRGWFFHGGEGDTHSSGLRIRERIAVGGRHYIAIVDCDGQKFLIGISPTSITSIGELKSQNITQATEIPTPTIRKNDSRERGPVLE
jgi:flagellar biogenesis protein FliO